ncbi:SRPBCC family protein [Mesobacillus sp. AQ2]|uniref:SRPBCC family protein n=1 Tax=Mesobacillus sp. AQ2 TaxID=3043332 RepID=UPI0024C17C60|nr:SRPBCC family protein [Mesobacillus sp. AQ2]WHX40400.1 SRPBCC family protein [Mesobacillus sp. AQ2]
MPTIKHEILIKAPIEICFDLARNVDIHMVTASKTFEKAIGGVTNGLLEEGDMVTWEAVHFKIRQRLTAQVTKMTKPYEFVDVMVKGAFHSFTHTHQFSETEKGTLMVDIFQYKSPLGLLGRLADNIFLEKYMYEFIRIRGISLKKIAEAEQTN